MTKLNVFDLRSNAVKFVQIVVVVVVVVYLNDSLEAIGAYQEGNKVMWRA